MDIYKVNAELMAKRNQVISLNGEIARKNVEIACNLEQMKRKDEEISRKNEEISIKDKEIAMKNDEIASKSEEVFKLRGKLRQLKEAFKQIDIEDLEASIENSPETTVVAAEPDKMVEEVTENQENGANEEVQEDNSEADDEGSSGSSPAEQQQIDAGSDNSQSHALNQLPSLSILQLQQRWASSSTSSVSPINHKDASENTPGGGGVNKPLVSVPPGFQERIPGPGSLSSDLNSSNSDPDPRMIFHPEDSAISGHGLMIGGEFLIDPQMPMGPLGPMLMGHPQMRPVPMVPPHLMESPMGKPMGPMPMHMPMSPLRPPMMYHPQMGQQIYVQAGQHPLKLTNRPPMGPFIRPVPVYPQMELQPMFNQTGEPMTD